jgi:hypothetical protein
LQRFMNPPAWLGPAGHAEPVRAALIATVPEFVAGALSIQKLVVKRMRLKKGQSGWTGQYEATVAGPGSDSRAVMLFARLIPPDLPAPELAGAQGAFGAEDWRCYLPDLRLELQSQPADPALPALPRLTDPEQARALLESGIRACSPAYADISIQSCAIKHLRYKPGSRATVVYELTYAPEHAARAWPPIVVAKPIAAARAKTPTTAWPRCGPRRYRAATWSRWPSRWRICPT